ncbi:MAG: HNH endonuclease [Hydrogenophaga sp.]|nr:HNH endonuclease [Hydrogenophaga sp.]
MPSSAPRPCTHPGCGVLVRDGKGRCAKHQRSDAKAVDELRGTSAQRGYGYKWQQAREGFLRAHPLCVKHEARGELVPATVVDHITPHRGDMSVFWLRSNWQPLCKLCHDVKTAREDGAFGRARLQRP